jgi:hypothetical protein
MRNWIVAGVILVLLIVSDFVFNEGKVLYALQNSVQESLTSLVD